jgi:hypothetical protein
MSISIEDFNAHFIVNIRSLARPHIDETGTIPADVGINVICTLNNRVQFFEHHFTDQAVVDSSTDQQLLDLAWAALKSDIQTWASTAINLSNLIGYVYTPTSEFNNTYGNLNLTSYNSNFDTIVNRFEVYPKNEPSSWCVGYYVTNQNNNEYLYVDTLVSVTTFAIITAESDILNDAWDNLKDRIGDWANSKIDIPTLLNTDYIPAIF